MKESKKDEIIERANRQMDKISERPMSVEQFIQELVENPELGRSAHQYLLDAIDYFGKRQVFERGEEKERYRFFDDPANDGEHAVLGNTDVINRFVQGLRVVVDSDDRMQKIILFSGPTATGKSELKRCIINGLEEYSATDEGRKYTCDWNQNRTSDFKGRMYGDMDMSSVSQDDWNSSPVQVNPISIIPKSIRKEIDAKNEDLDIITDVELDPFSQEEYESLKSYYEGQKENDLFSQIIDDNNVRVRRYRVRPTKGIGVLSAEDEGSVKERLLGSWMPSMLRDLGSVGRKDPRAFSYDGVLSQGNGGVMVVEDASKHSDILLHLLNVPDEGHAKIDKEIGFDVDTVPIFISNPDLTDRQLNRTKNKQVPVEELNNVDSGRAIKRRILQYRIKYLTSLTNESRLLRKELNGFTDQMKSGKTNPRDPMNINSVEFTPHSIRSAALYDVVSRLTVEDIPSGLDIVDKALLFDEGHIETDSGKKSIEDLKIEDSEKDGSFGIPVTYTRDIVSSLAHSGEDIYMPEDVLTKISDGLSDTPIFDNNELQEYRSRLDEVKEHVRERQENDVIESILYDRTASEEAVTEYVDNLYEWQKDEEYDEYLIKDFEMRHLGTVEENYNGQEPRSEIVDLRIEQIIRPLNRYHWRERGEKFETSDTRLSEVPVLSSILGDYSWVDVFTVYPNLNPSQYENPPDDTTTSEIKRQCVENMKNNLGYTEKSAEMTFEKVFDSSRQKLREIKQKATE